MPLGHHKNNRLREVIPILVASFCIRNERLVEKVSIEPARAIVNRRVGAISGYNCIRAVGVVTRGGPLTRFVVPDSLTGADERQGRPLAE